MLARVGALLCTLSLLLPWYVLEADHGLRGLGKSGAAALGVWSLVLVVLAAVAGSALISRVQALVPPIAATGLVLLVVTKIVFPPPAFGASSGTQLEQQITSAFASALSRAADIHYGVAWGIWVAAIGAAVSLLGTIAAAAAE
jgi:hypothetical protein